MRPHEETWEIDEQAVKDGDYTATDSEGFAVLTTYAKEEGGGDELAEARLRLATVAPEMARALMEMLDILEGIREGSYKVDTFTDQTIRAALAKSGVVP